MLNTFLDRADEMLDGLRLIALRNVIAYKFEVHYCSSSLALTRAGRSMTAAKGAEYTTRKYTCNVEARAIRHDRHSRKVFFNKS